MTILQKPWLLWNRPLEICAMKHSLITNIICVCLLLHRVFKGIRHYWFCRQIDPIYIIERGWKFDYSELPCPLIFRLQSADYNVNWPNKIHFHTQIQFFFVRHKFCLWYLDIFKRLPLIYELELGWIFSWMNLDKIWKRIVLKNLNSNGCVRLLLSVLLGSDL